jgi:hypothetical protein
MFSPAPEDRLDESIEIAGLGAVIDKRCSDGEAAVDHRR